MNKLSFEKIIRDIAFIFAISIALTGLFRFFFDFNVRDQQVILRKADLHRFDRCAIISPDHKKISGLILAGLPGDTIYITNSEPFVNSQNISDMFFSLFMIDLSSEKKITLDQFPVAFTYMTFEDYHSLENQLFIQPVSLPAYTFDSITYPHNPHVPWNKDNFGKFIIPYKGLKLKLNDYTFMLYAPLIKEFEHTTIHKKGKQFFINGRPIAYYTFKKNYYFFLNKNLYYPIDSRTWGPLPRSHVIGKIIQMPTWTRLIITKIDFANNFFANYISQLDLGKILPQRQSTLFQH